MFSPRENKLFPIFISLYNALLFAFIVGIETRVDSQYVNTAYGLRIYPLGYSVCFISVVVFLSTLYITRNIKSPFNKAICTFGSFELIIFVLLRTNFYIGSPNIEFPNMGIVAFTSFAEFVVSLIIYIHYSGDILSYITNIYTLESAIIERIKFDYDLHIKSLVTVIAAYFAGFYTMYSNLNNIIETFTADPVSHTIIFNSILLSIFVFSGSLPILS